MSGELVVLSVQGAAPYGTFNEEAANDERFPFAWRAVTERDRPLFARDEPIPDAELADRLRANTIDYIVDHPASMPQAFFWNGIVRTFVPVLVLALSVSLVYTSIGGTRYRAPIEPLIVVLAASAPRKLRQRSSVGDRGLASVRRETPAQTRA